MITARVTNLRIEQHAFSLTGGIAEAYVFDWTVHTDTWAVDAKLVREALKREVPAADRDWDPVGRRWSVKVEYHQALCRIFDRFNEDVKALANQPALF
jgi:hypothetical protein